jgi:diguanylate cyclase (GGDEF)-like protein
MPPHAATLLGAATLQKRQTNEPARPRLAFDLRRQLWQVYLVVGMALILGYFLLPSADVRSWAYDVFGPLAALAIVIAVLVHRPGRPWIWLGLAGGSLLLGLGDFVFSLLALNNAAVPLPSFADVLYLSGYLLIAISLTKLSISLVARGSRHAGADRANTIDAAIIALAVAFVSIDSLIKGFADQPPADLLAGLTTLAYPVMDILFVWVAVRLLLSSKRHGMALGLLVLGLIAFLLSDTEFAYGSASYVPGDLVDLGWLLGYVAWAIAAAHPSMRTLTAPSQEVQTRLVSRSRLTLLGIAAATPSLGLLIPLSAGVDNINFGLAIIGSLVMIGLVSTRLSMMGLDLSQTVTERDGLQDEVSWRKQYDALTGLANRASFQEQALAFSPDGLMQTAVVALNIDGFGLINDELGVAAGDRVLVEVATHLKACFGIRDLVARVGGDEFAVLFAASEVQDVVRRVQAALAKPIALEGRPLRLQASIGVAIIEANEPGRDPLGEALVALRVAKVQAKGGYEVFRTGMVEELAAANGLRADLEQAVARDEFEVYYQPVLHVANGELEGAEALVRWHHPEQGLVPPIKFIGLAEESGLIVPIGRFVLEAACAQAATWIRQHPEHADFAINVNLSPAQMRSSDVVGDVSGALRRSGLPAGNLVLELTEGLFIDGERYEGTLNALKALGVRLAMDDFGTGYSSLSYLGRLPFDVLKIDRSFFLALAAGRPEGALVAVIRQIAATLGMTTVAEGIEGMEQFAYVRELGVDMVQTFMFGRPVPADEFATHFEQTSTARGIAPVAVAA